MGSEYLVNISVYAVAGLKVPGDAAGMPNPYVEVECLGEKRTTQVISGASACTFNNFYNFSKHMSEDDFTGGDAVVAVYHQKNSFGFKVKLGQVTFSLEKVYNQDGHLVPKDWFVIVLPDDPGKGCGYVELSLGAYAPGDIVPQSVSGGADVDEAAEVQSIKTRVVKLPTKDAAKSLFQLTVCIYQAEQLAMIKGMMGSSCNPFVQVDFNGTSQRTQTQRNNNPTWNEEVQVPFSMPAWDNSVNVTVFHDGGLTGSKVELGDVTLDIDNLAEEALEPSWFYFYKAPDGKKEEKSEFAGRMLVSASMERTEKPILTINPGSIANPPKVTAGVAWIDLYMVCFDSTEQPEQLYVQIELPRIIDAEVLSSQPEPEGHGFVWKGKEIRLDHMVPTFSLPAPENCGEFIISVYAKFKKKGLLGGKKPERYMYARVPAEEVCKWDQTPRWRDMRMVVHGGEDVGSAGFLLLTLCLGSESLKPTRLKPMKIKWRDYCFRVKIYQAVNLPAKDEEGSSDPLVALNFGPAILRTRLGHVVKCVLLGPSMVGKSALVARYCDETFVKTYLPTIGVDFRVGEIATQCQQFKFKLQFWDTAGQERFRTITLSYLRGTRSIMAVFSLENRNSLHEAVSMVRQAMGYFDESNGVLVCLVGTHADSAHQEVTEDEAWAEAEKLGCSYHAVSNVNGEGVPEAFHNWLDQYLEQMYRKRASGECP